ncbi:MAG TPA: winged helix-turn-helix domain-containing protein [Pyrinomonadaceae bacterium]|nr:winged helix-turn-helix domain-containing protein [Pyrinomonadaceae bacterium]
MSVYEFGEYRLESEEKRLYRNHEIISIPPKAFDILATLVESGGHLFSKEDLFHAVWPDSFVADSSLTQNIYVLRKALGEGPGAPTYIETVPRRGYRFIAEVQRVTDSKSNEIALSRNGKHDVVSTLIGRATSRASFPAYTSILRTHWRSQLVVFLCLLLTSILIASYFSRSNSQNNASVKSLAVLPFKVLGEEAGTDHYAGLGMADSTIIKLASLQRFTVLPTSSVFKYANGDHDPVAAGRELGVEAVLIGSIQSNGQRVRVSGQLLRVRDGATLWAANFDESFADIFAVQDSISQRVASALVDRLSNQDGQQLAKRPTENREAFEAYSRGLFFWNQRTEAATRQAVDYFQQAIMADPNFALAHSMLADSYALIGFYRYKSILCERDAYTKAEAAVTNALSLNSEISEAHVALAFIKLYYHQDPVSAEKEFKRAIDLNPGNAYAHQRYSSLLLVQGKLDQALSEVQLAHQLDPLSTRISLNLSTILYYRRQYADAEEVCRRALELSPNEPVLNQQIGNIKLTQGNHSEAMAYFRKAHDVGGSDYDYLEGSAHVYAMTGRIDETRRMISEVEASASQTGHFYRIPATLVMLYAAVRDIDKALTFIEDKKDWDVFRMRPLLEFEPLLDSLREDDRFKELVARRFGVVGVNDRLLSSHYRTGDHRDPLASNPKPRSLY